MKNLSKIVAIMLLANLIFNWQGHYNLFEMMAVHYDDVSLKMTNDGAEKFAILSFPKTKSAAKEFYNRGGIFYYSHSLKPGESKRLFIDATSVVVKNHLSYKIENAEEFSVSEMTDSISGKMKKTVKDYLVFRISCFLVLAFGLAGAAIYLLVQIIKRRFKVSAFAYVVLLVATPVIVLNVAIGLKEIFYLGKMLQLC